MISFWGGVWRLNSHVLNFHIVFALLKKKIYRCPADCCLALQRCILKRQQPLSFSFSGSGQSKKGLIIDFWFHAFCLLTVYYLTRLLFIFNWVQNGYVPDLSHSYIKFVSGIIAHSFIFNRGKKNHCYSLLSSTYGALFGSHGGDQVNKQVWLL